MRYWALRIVSFLYTGLGLIVLLISVALFIDTEVSAIQNLERIATSIGAIPTIENYTAVSVTPFLMLVGGIIGGITLFAVGQFITLMIDVEANTRGIRGLLLRQSSEKDLIDTYKQTVNGPWEPPRSTHVWQPNTTDWKPNVLETPKEGVQTRPVPAPTFVREVKEL